MLTNTQEFRREALHFEKYGYYTRAPRGTMAYRQYWDEQMQRCREGYTVGDTRITGYHYYYLNFSPIMLVKSDFTVLDKRVKGDRIEGFPAFWDLDYHYFHALEQAEITGQHMVVLKARGKGFSFKGASMLARNFNLYRKSKGYAFAALDAFLTGDGLLTKTWSNLSFINQHTAWTKRRQVKNADLHKRASYWGMKDGVEEEKGYMSEVIGLSLKDDPNKSRGKRGKLVLWEESGSFPHLQRAWQICRSSMEEGPVTFGTMIAFGTGGEEGATFESLEDMFFSPSTYNAIGFDNIWDKDGGKCGYFVPDYISLPPFMDKDGNSDVKAARAFQEAEREKIKATASKPEIYDQAVAEHPFTPREAMLNTAKNIFPQNLLLQQRSYLRNSERYKALGIPGEFHFREGRLRFEPNYALEPLYHHNTKNANSLHGAIVIHQSPFKINGKVPDGLYFICHDPYAFDQGVSMGATYVMKRINNVSHPDDMIVASYVGRPDTLDEYNKNLFDLAHYYNALICFENDRGDVLSYAKRTHNTHMLAPELELNFNRDIAYVGKRGYGVMIGSGKDNRRRKQGLLYLRDWLITPRSQGEDGEVKLNLHYIYDIALLDELIKYHADGNFDRVDALTVGMFMDKEMEWLGEEAATEQAEEMEQDSFWNREHFVNPEELY